MTFFTWRFDLFSEGLIFPKGMDGDVGWNDGQMKMHRNSPGQASHPNKGTINHEPLCPYFPIYPSRHPSLSEACWCLTDRVTKKRERTMRWGTWVTSTTAKWWIIPFRRSKEINIFGRQRKTLRRFINHAFFCFPQWIDAPFLPLRK